MKHLFVVAHPDDELLGCLGTILMLIRGGNDVVVYILSTKSKTRENGLKNIARAIHTAIGIKKTYFGNCEMMMFGTYDRYDMTKAVEHVIQTEEPDYIYTHDPGDIHNDHRVLSQIVTEASKLPIRGTGYNKPIRGLYYIEVPSSTDWGAGFVPNAFVEIDERALELKAAYMMNYEGVLREVPHPRNLESFKALARYRGGQCGVPYAEGFRKAYELITEGKDV